MNSLLDEVLRMAKEVDVYLDPEKLSRAARKMFLLLVKKTRSPFESYAAIVIVKSFLKDEFGLKEGEFKPIVDEFFGAIGDFE